MYVNAKMILVETVPERGEGEIKENSGGGEFKCGIVKNLCKCYNYPHPAQR
jgi:hypothetical protein